MHNTIHFDKPLPLLDLKSFLCKLDYHIDKQMPRTHPYSVARMQKKISIKVAEPNDFIHKTQTSVTEL